MGHTYTNLMYHGVFSTKERRPLLMPDMMPDLVKVVGGVVNQRDGKLLAMNGTENHVHLLMVPHAKHALSDIFRDVKAISSDWIHDSFAQRGAFAWQEGYSAFTVSKSNADKVENYIARQAEHHEVVSFEEELIALLEKHGIQYDMKYVLD